MLTTHTFLPYCWVCRTKFGPNTKEERHHIIPKAFGGVDGPQVSLCDSHHSALHEIGLKLYSKSSYFQLLTRDFRQNKKLLWLATVACNARIATENDPNKAVPTVFYFKGETLKKLKRLKQVYPKASRQALVLAAIDVLYDRHFKE